MGDHTAPEPLVDRWRELEPVRLALYPVLVSVVGMFVARGVITADLAPYLMAVFAALLGVAGIETARGSVDSPATVREREHGAFADGVRAALHRTPDTTAERGGVAPE